MFKYQAKDKATLKSQLGECRQNEFLENEIGIGKKEKKASFQNSYNRTGLID